MMLQGSFYLLQLCCLASTRKGWDLVPKIKEILEQMGTARSWRPEMPHFYGNQWSRHLDKCIDQFLTPENMGLDRLSRSDYSE